MRRSNRVRVWRDPIGMYIWACGVENCRAPVVKCGGASVHWEVAQHQADDHVRDWHADARHLPHDPASTPPGVAVFDWSETGQHLRMGEQR